MSSLSFPAEAVGTNPVFKTDFDRYTNAYATEAFKEMVEKNCLSGVFFSEDLTSTVGN